MIAGTTLGYQIAIGNKVTSIAEKSFVIGTGYDGGNYLVNNIPNSLKIGFNSVIATIFVTQSALPTATGNVGIGLPFAFQNPLNKLDVGGNMTIGDGYAGQKTAPANGLIVEGKVGIGTSTINSLALLQLKGNVPNLYITDNSTGPTSINLRNNNGYWHISGPRSGETGKPLSIFWNDNSNYSEFLVF